MSSHRFALLKHWLLRGVFTLFGSLFLLAQSTPNQKYNNNKTDFNNIKNLYFNSLSDKDGLLDNTNSFIYLDSRGFVWISSMSGINRFDGTKIKQYKIDSNVTPQSPFFETKNGDIWFTHSNNITVYRRSLDKFEHFYLNASAKELVIAHYYAFYLDKEERLWIRIRDDKAKSYIFDTKTNKQIELCPIPYLRAKPFFNEKTGKLSVFNYNWGRAGLRQYIFSDSTTFKKPILREWTPEKYSQFANLSIYTVQPLGDTALWLGTNQGLGLFHLASARLQLFKTFNTRQKNLTIGTIKSLAPLSNNMLAVGTAEQGLLFFNTTVQEFQYQYYPEPYHLKDGGLPFVEINDLYLDRENNLWISDWTAGIAYTNLDEHPLEHITLADLPQKFAVAKILQRKNGEIWASSTDNGIVVLNAKAEILKHYTSNDFPNDRYMTICEDSSARIWLAGRSHSFLFDPVAKKFIKTPNLRDNQAFKDFILLPDNKVLGRTNQNEFYQFIVNENQQIVATPYKEFSASFEDTLKNYTIQSCIYDDNFLYIVASNQTKSFVFKLKYNFSLKEWEIVNSFQTYISDLVSCRKYKDVHVYYNSFNISIFDKKTETFKYIKANNINILSIESVSYLGDNQLLIVGQSKVYRYDYITKYSTLVAISTKPIIFGNDLVNNTEIWLGTTTGILKLDRKNFNTTTKSPIIQLNNIKINDAKDYNDNNVSENNIFVFDYDNNTLTFDVTAISYSYAFRPRLRYQLEGIDGSSLYAEGSAITVRYAKLTHGTYNLCIEAIDARTEKVLLKKQITIIIKTPWWKHWIAYICYILFMGGIVWAIFEYRIKKLKKESDIKEQIMAERMKALRAQISPHFIFNSVRSIKDLLNKHQIISAISYIENFTQLMRGTLEAVQENKISLEDDIKLLNNYVNNERIAQNIHIAFETHCIDDFDPYEVAIPGMILQLFVENAIIHGIKPKTYSQGEIPTITITFKILELEKDNYLQCVIHDNGIGYNSFQAQNRLKHSHKSYGLKITRERLELLRSAKQASGVRHKIKNFLFDKQKHSDFKLIAIKGLQDMNNQLVGTEVIVLIPLEF